MIPIALQPPQPRRPQGHHARRRPPASRSSSSSSPRADALGRHPADAWADRASEDVAIVLRMGPRRRARERHRGASRSASSSPRPAWPGRPTARPSGAGELVVVVILEKLGAKEGMSSNVQIRGMPDNGLNFRRDAHIVEGRARDAGHRRGDRGRAPSPAASRACELGGGLRPEEEPPREGRGRLRGRRIVLRVRGVGRPSALLRAAFGREGRSLERARAPRLAGPARRVPHGRRGRTRSSACRRCARPDYYEKQSEGTSLFIKAMGIVIAVFFSIGAMIGADDHDVRGRREPAARDRHAARARLLAREHPLVVPPRVGAPLALRRGARRGGVAPDGRSCASR